MEAWRDFNKSVWQDEVNVFDFIKSNYKEYKGDDSFLANKTIKTKEIWEKCELLLKEELEKGVLDVETNIVSGINNYKPGYICDLDDVIVGLQTDKPLKREVNPFGGMRMVKSSLEAYGYDLNPVLEKYFNSFLFFLLFYFLR